MRTGTRSEGELAGTYASADSSLWFFHALERYVEASGDTQTIAQLMPTLRKIIELHVAESGGSRWSTNNARRLGDFM